MVFRPNVMGDDIAEMKNVLKKYNKIVLEIPKIHSKIRNFDSLYEFVSIDISIDFHWFRYFSYFFYFYILLQNIFTFSDVVSHHIWSEKHESINNFGFFWLAQNPYRKLYSHHILFTDRIYGPNACPNSVGRSTWCAARIVLYPQFLIFDSVSRPN